MKKIMTIISIILFMMVNVVAQNSTYIMPKEHPYLVPPNPEAASFLKYGEYPVSHSTGLPDITIPIYTIQSGSLTFPISLSYHAGGIRVDDIASWVGLGWTLNAGGVVNRSIQGMPDKEYSMIMTEENIRKHNMYDMLLNMTIPERMMTQPIHDDLMKDRYDYTFEGNPSSLKKRAQKKVTGT